MRILSLFAAGLAVLSFGGDSAQAEAKKGAPAPSETVRYFQLADDFFGDLPADGFLKETRQGARLTSAVIDVCHSVSLTSPRKDRFTVTLRAEGPRLTGSGQTQEAKQRVAVNLVRKPAGKTVTFEGSITLGNDKWEISSTGNTDMSEKEFLENAANDNTVVSEPADFIELSPGSIAVQVKRESFAALVKAVKSENVEIMLETLALDCSALRTGEQQLQLLVDPERAPALVKKLKALPGIVDVGWVSGDYTIDRSVRLAAADWKGGSVSFDKERLASALADALAKNFRATIESTGWNATTGELKIALKRPSESIPGLDLSDHIETVMVIGPETLRSNDGLIVWLRDTAINVVDSGPEPQLRFVNPASEEAELIDEDMLLGRIAQDLKGKRWNSDQGAWQ